VSLRDFEFVAGQMDLPLFSVNQPLPEEVGRPAERGPAFAGFQEEPPGVLFGKSYHDAVVRDPQGWRPTEPEAQPPDYGQEQEHGREGPLDAAVVHGAEQEGPRW
jgi:hypothetical protein